MLGIELEVVWPLHKCHYLNPSLQDQDTNMADDVTADPAPVVATGCELAARALLAATACTQQRIADLLETSRRSVGRAAESDLVAALHNTAVVAEARTVLAATARRGSTDEERAAAETWLADALRDEQPSVSPARRPRGRRSTKTASTRLRRPTTNTPRPEGRPVPEPDPAALPPPQIEALERQRQRILHRTTLLDYVLAAEQRNGAGLTLSDALAELVRDISDAARQVGTILQQTATRAALH